MSRPLRKLGEPPVKNRLCTVDYTQKKNNAKGILLLKKQVNVNMPYINRKMARGE